MEKNKPEVNPLFEENEKLKALISEYESKESSKKELDRLLELFPDICEDDIPASVRESVGGSMSLAAAYALYEREELVKKLLAEEANAALAAKSTGAVTDGGEANSSFSLDEIKRMSRSDVRKNYRQIIKSLSK